ncbi:MAG: VOC family protein, partial [Sphingopyxis sp.]
SVASIVAAGGAVMMPAMDLAGVGRMAMVTDGQGVPFYVMRGSSDETSHAFAATAPKVGHCAWNELSTTDPASAVAFYTAQFGWRQDGEMDMGPMGKYQFLYHGEPMIGAIMPKMPSMPAAWTYYFRVADIDGAVAAIKANGGSLLMEPMEIPGGEFALNARDPQGAAFAIMGPRK